MKSFEIDLNGNKKRIIVFESYLLLYQFFYKRSKSYNFNRAVMVVLFELYKSLKVALV